jgi:hypothetical protein
MSDGKKAPIEVMGEIAARVERSKAVPSGPSRRAMSESFSSPDDVRLILIRCGQTIRGYRLFMQAFISPDVPCGPEADRTRMHVHNG